MPKIPRVPPFDSTIALRRDPYRFITRRCRAVGSDVFETRLLLQKTICMTGSEAARVFYDEERFMRHTAPPRRIQATLFGRGGVQGLDGEAHRHRKRMLSSLMTPERVADLTATTANAWRDWARARQAADHVVLYDAARDVLFRSVCSWAGVPLGESEVRRRIGDLTAQFDDAGAIGPKYWRSRVARRRGNRWAEEIIDQVRAGDLKPHEHRALAVIASHRDLDGRLLPPYVPAVELLNILRPTTAVAVFIVFAALALHTHPQWRAKLNSLDPDATWRFVQEVRRYYPFFPAVVARVRREFEWNGYRFPRGTRTLLDLFGTNRDPRTWDDPERFRPERFERWDGDAFNFIPQGGNDVDIGHRCPGEDLTIELMRVAAEFLATHITYDVPEQDLYIKPSSLPAMPQSRFIITNVRAVPAANERLPLTG